MKANEVPDKVYLLFNRPYLVDYTKLSKRRYEEEVEYTRTDAFIEKAAEFLYKYNQKQVLKHGARATLGCGEYTINVYEFRKYMEGWIYTCKI